MTAVNNPRLLGLDPTRLATLLENTRRQCELGQLNSCQIAVARQGRLGLFATVGAAAPGSAYAIYSVSKPLLAAAFWLLMAEPGIDETRPVVDFIPQFGANGKAAVTLEQLLTHTAGFPGAILGPPQWYSRSERVQSMSQWQLEWAPGSRCQYHPTSSFWVLAEVVERICQQDYRQFIAQQLTLPLGLEGFRLGVPLDEQQMINEVRSVGSPACQAELDACFGSTTLAPETAEHKMLLLMNDPQVRALGVPGGGAIATAAEVALFYQALLHNPGELWAPGILADATTTIRASHNDPFGGYPANRSLGLIIQGDDGMGDRRGMGLQYTSAASFGHHGAGGQVAWADPESGISFCFLTDSLDANAARVAQRGPLLSDLAALCALDR
jgi:CubicO group peptidase (beta-lactamase class C family)